jgi:glycosyltransferase involved in cell wall biosynthesis
MTKGDRISLLVPCRNAETFLPRLFEGVTRQTRPFSEIICYDDNSTDRTAAVARQLGAQVICATGVSRGPAVARNRLAEAAAGDWIHFHDADDLISEQFAEQLWTEAANADGVFCDADWVIDDTRELIIAWRYSDHDLQKDPLDYLIRHPVGINNGIFRRSMFLKVGGFNESLRMWEDADLYVRFAAVGARLKHLRGVWTWSLRHADSFSHNYTENWNWRVTALEGYAQNYPAARVAIGWEAERAADELLALGDSKGARRALAICRRVGHRAPAGGGPFVAIARALFPATMLLKLRRRRRTPR